MESRNSQLKLDTLPKLLRQRALEIGDRQVAMRVKDRGIWQSYTWKDYFEHVRDLCLGLTALGLQRGDAVSIIGENKPEWYWAELAAQSAGAVAVGIFTDCQAPEVQYFVGHSESTFVVAHDQEQLDKVLEILAEVPEVKNIIYWDPKGLWGYDHPNLLSMNQVMEMGRKLGEQNPNLYEELVAQGSGDDAAAICYTSGTTGLPKGAVMSQRFLTEHAKEWSEIDGWNREGIEYLSFVPPAWAVEQFLGIAGGIVARMPVNFPEEPETVQENIREIGPNVMFFGARMWENINSTVQARIMDSTPVRRWLFNRFMAIGLKLADRKIEQKHFGRWHKLLYWIAYQAMFRPLRDRLGLPSAEVVYSAGGALSPEIIRFFLALGIEIKLFYGSTEMGIITVPRPGQIHPETSGVPMPWAEVKISEDGEILVKNKYLFTGYYRNPEATQAKIKDGYYCSGDFGHINEAGHLIVIDRMEDLKSLSTGQKFSPQYTEVRLRFSPFIKDAIVVGGQNRDFVTSLINIDLDNVGRFAESKHILYTTFTDLSQKPEVIQLVKEEIRKVNRSLPDHARIRCFVNLHKEFDADEAELTRTRKLRRSFVEKRYENLIEGMYGNTDEIAVEAAVTYRDGSQGLLRTSIRVNAVE